MKKTLIATAALLSLQATAVSAANVNIYGVIEEGILVQKTDGANATTELKSAFDLGSRVGLKGSEDLGNGAKVGFILESGFSPDTGAYANGTSGFTRESLLYVQSDNFGRLGFGRTGTLRCGLQSFNMQTGYVFMNGYGLIGWDQNMNNFLRASNVIAYQTPVKAGFDAGLMYSNGFTDDSAKNGRTTNTITALHCASAMTRLKRILFWKKRAKTRPLRVPNPSMWSTMVSNMT